MKKVIFAPLFLTSLTFAIYFYKLILDQKLDVYFREYGGLYEFALMIVPLIITSLMFSLFVTFSQDIKYAAAAALIASIIPYFFLNTNLSIVIGIGLFLVLILTFFSINTNLKTYTNFQPGAILTGPIKTLNFLILLVFTFGYFLNFNAVIQKEGFKIPDKLLDWAIDMSLSSQGMQVKGEKYYLAQMPTVTQEQIDLLKQNPQMLDQFGIKPEDLDAITPAPAQTQVAPESPNRNKSQVIPQLPGVNIKDVLKNQMSDAFGSMLKPYLFAIPIFLAVIFYSLASLVSWVLSLFISPTISLIFLILDKSGFVKYEKEMREVKKIVV